MKKNALLGVVLLTIMISSCSTSTGDSPITPASDRPTFLYFYTDG